MIVIDHISFRYRKSKQKQFGDFYLPLGKGRVYGLLGKNGVGKSTLLYLMAGLLAPQKGEVWMDGTDVFRRLPATLREIFLVPEQFELPAVGLKRYIELNAPFYPRFNREKLESYLLDFDMDTDLHLGALSMGQKKKVLISFALAADTSLLLMDEPTNGLDIPAKSQFRKIIASGMNDDKTIVISTHQVRDIDKLLDHVLILDRDRLLFDRSVDQITGKLLFCESGLHESTDDALFVQPSLHGNSMLIAGSGKEDESSGMNLELLFNAVLADPKKINRVFEPIKE